MKTVVSALLAAGILYLVFASKISWAEALVGLGLVLTPASASMIKERMVKRNAKKYLPVYPDAELHSSTEKGPENRT